MYPRISSCLADAQLACRLINRALTGPVAKRRNAVNAAHVKEAWEALEGCWEEFESIRDMSPGQYASGDEIIRYVGVNMSCDLADL